jgi:hypothetical protein
MEKLHHCKWILLSMALLAQTLMAQSPVDSATVKSTSQNADSVTSIKYRVSAELQSLSPMCAQSIAMGIGMIFLATTMAAFLEIHTEGWFPPKSFIM